MSWMAWLRDRCLDLTGRLATGSEGAPDRPRGSRARGHVPGSASEPPVTHPVPGADA